MSEHHIVEDTIKDADSNVEESEMLVFKHLEGRLTNLYSNLEDVR